MTTASSSNSWDCSPQSRWSRYQSQTPSPAAAGSKETTMSTSLKLKLIALFTTIAMFALPVADAFAGRSWG
jgi:hypothetical protein